MKILAIERAVNDAAPETVRRYLREEAAKAWELYQSGVVRELYVRADALATVLVLECANVAEAEQVLAQFPLVQAGLIAFELIPLTAYPGFARLFGAVAG
jgi:muconolactone delta-isomerase